MHPLPFSNTQQAQPAAGATGQAGQAYPYGTQINQSVPWQQSAPVPQAGPYAQAYAAPQPGYVQQAVTATQGNAAAAPWQLPAAAAQPWQAAAAGNSATWPAAQQQYPAGAPGYPGQQYPRIWVGTVTQLIPPNYGIVDGDAFYVEQQVVGRVPKVGDKVNCEAIPNTDGGKYKWRVRQLQAVDIQGAAQTALATPASAALAAAQASARTIAASHAASAPRSSPMPSHLATRPAALPVSAPISAATTSATAAPAERKYNNAPPPTAAYTADLALAAVSSMMDSSREAAPTANGATPAKAPYSRPPPQLSDEDKQRAQMTAQRYSQFGKGAELISKMGFGMKGPGLGAQGQGIAAPVDPKSTRAGMGLGFDGSDQPARQQRSRPGWERPGGGAVRPRDSARERGRARSRSPTSSSTSSSRSSGSSRSSSSARSGSRSRSPSPLRRHVAIPPQFPVGVEPVRGTATLTRRYRNMYVPSEFSTLSCAWMYNSWGPQPVSSILTHPLAFEINPVSTDTLTANGHTHSLTHQTGRGADAAQGGSSNHSGGDCKWSVCVALCSGMPATAHPSSGTDRSQHPVASLHFLVCNNKGSAAASKDVKLADDDATALTEHGSVCGQPVWPHFLPGGCWEPCDGPHPSQDASVLVHTAVRCVKESTGIDLSPCCQWLQVAEVKYLREKSSKQPATAALSNVLEERTVLFLVDTWSAARPNVIAAKARADAQALVQAEEMACSAVAAAEDALKAAEQTYAECTKARGGKESRSSDSTLDASKLTVAQLQEELSKRGLDTRWDPLKGKKQLQDRLQVYLDQKRAEHAQVDEELRKELEAKEAVTKAKQRLAAAKSSYNAVHAAAQPAKEVLRKYVPPLHIKAWPSQAAAAAGVGLAVASLQDLLEYRDSSKTQGQFELQLFAETFLEMLTVQFATALLHALPVVIGREQHAADVGSKHQVMDTEKEGAASGPAVTGAVAENASDVAPASTVSAGQKRDLAAANVSSIEASKRAKLDTCSQGESLLWCCRFFDTRRAGYLLRDDLEETLYMACSTATRRQVQALVDSVAKRGRFSYMEYSDVHAPPLPASTHTPPASHNPSNGLCGRLNANESPSSEENLPTGQRRAETSAAVQGGSQGMLTMHPTAVDAVPQSQGVSGVAQPSEAHAGSTHDKCTVAVHQA